MTEAKCRRLPIAGAFNVRDLGGYPTRTGPSTAWRAFVRADSLHNATLEGQLELLNYGVRTIIDLRSAGEIARSPVPLAIRDVVTYHHIAVVDDAALPGAATAIPEDLAALYRVYLEGSRASFRRIFAAIATAGRGTVLFNCTAGKDRTGIVAALLLGLAGVDTAIIVSDYSESAENLAPLFGPLRQSMQTQASPAERTAAERLLGSDAVMMESTLAYLDGQYGGVEAYLRHLGLDDVALSAIRARLVPEPASETSG